jgi:hypothetical protein
MAAAINPDGDRARQAEAGGRAEGKQAKEPDAIKPGGRVNEEKK